jgi:transcriptional regulator with XRE-family HTH domain
MHITTGEVIRRIRKSRGMTQRELGALLGYTQPVISQLERNGPAVHDVRMLRRVARALEVPLAILVVESNEEADVRRRQFFKASALGAGAVAAVGAADPIRVLADPTSTAANIKVGASDIAAINQTRMHLQKLDLVAGGDRLCDLATGYVHYVEQLLATGSYTDAIGRELTSAAAGLMTEAGWVHHDAGRLEAARRYYADAAQLAASIDDGISAAHALCWASFLMVDRGNDTAGAGLAVQYAQAASRAALSHGGPKLRALMAVHEATALGARGDRPEMTKAISRAYRAYESDRGYDPGWVYMPEAELIGQTGAAQMRSGEYKTAMPNLQAAVDGSEAWPRECISWQLDLAHNLIRVGEIAQGCSLLTANLDEVNGIASARSQTKMNSVVKAVRPHYKVPEVRDFLGARAEYLATS